MHLKNYVFDQKLLTVRNKWQFPEKKANWLNINYEHKISKFKWKYIKDTHFRTDNFYSVANYIFLKS